MPDKEKTMCEFCGEREAVDSIWHEGNLVCFGGDGAGHLCAVCRVQSLPLGELESGKRFKKAVQNGKCKYCGQPAAHGGGAYNPVLGEYLNLRCEQCQQDWAEFIRLPENKFPLVFPHGDPAAIERLTQQIRELTRRTEEHLKQKVLERGRKKWAPIKLDQPPWT